MSSRIEQIIEQMDEYLDSCKYKNFSNEVILVNKSEIEDILMDLKNALPEEITRYQKIISNKEAILSDAKKKAQELIDNATIQTNELISEHQIMQQAYAQANEIVDLASKQAQEILDSATTESNNMKAAAMQYTDDLLATLENIIRHGIETSSKHYTSLIDDLHQIENIVTTNRAELAPQPEEETADAPAEETQQAM